MKQTPTIAQEPDSTPEPVGRLVVGLVADAGWRRVGEIGGIPRWRWQEDQMIHVITYDHDVLRLFGSALNYYDTANLADSHAFITEHLLGGRSGIPNDEETGDRRVESTPPFWSVADASGHLPNAAIRAGYWGGSARDSRGEAPHWPVSTRR